MSRTPSLLGATLLVALTAAPLAHAAGEGNPLRGGVRNPSNDASQALTRETQVIGDSATYGTRQSNKSSNGGGAIYGCRSGAGGTASGNEPCVRANNLSNGFAFELVSNGPDRRVHRRRRRRRRPAVHDERDRRGDRAQRRSP